MKVAAYQAPLLGAGSMEALDLIRDRVKWCENEGVTILCCPEAILGGLADNDGNPNRFAISSDDGSLDAVLAPLASDSVATIIGFTERKDGRLYNTAAIVQQGRISGLYRKLHPAIRRSVYAPGVDVPVFQIGGLTFGIAICNDSNYREPFRVMADGGAAVIFIPTNNSLPPDKAEPEIVTQARNTDIERAREFGVWIVRADVAGSTGALRSFGCSGIVAASGEVVRTGEPLSEDIIACEIGRV